MERLRMEMHKSAGWTGRSSVLIFSVLCLVSTAWARLDVNREDGGFAVMRDGVRVAFARVDLGTGVPSNPKSSFAEKPDGEKAWNVWCEDEHLRYRMEAAVRADGAVEITVGGEMKCDSPYRTRRLLLTIPSSLLEGRDVGFMKGSGARYQTANVSFTEPEDKAFRDDAGCRYVAVGGVTYDFCPLGSSNETQNGPNSVDGVWDATREATGDVTFTGGAVVDKTYAGWSAAKVVIREGVLTDFDRQHFRRCSGFPYPLGYRHLFRFGAPKAGGAYADGDHSYSSMLGHGWYHDDWGSRGMWRTELGVKTHIGYPEGAWYSCLSCQGDSKRHGATEYLVSHLPDGFYVVTVGAGNYTGVTNRFDVLVNGEPLARDIVVPRRHARSLSRVFHVSGGDLRIRFIGEYILSVIGIQPLLADGEDFQMRRAFWVTDGYEPMDAIRNSDNADRKPFALSDETYFLPEPGKEGVGAHKAIPRPVEIPDRSSPSFAWMDNPRLYPLLFNKASLAELDPPEIFARKFDEMTAGKGINVVMLSGQLSRHTFPAHEDRVLRAIAGATRALHDRGLKVIDHHDITLCWNVGSGFRVLAERLNEMARTIDSGLPSLHFCTSNPVHNEKQYAYLRRLVAEAGVDGFQLDELTPFRDNCVCAACREKFHADTGWWLPMNECSEVYSAFVSARDSAVYRAWTEWRAASVGNWIVEARRRLKDLRDDLVFGAYTSHYAIFQPLGACFLSDDIVDSASRTVNLPGTEVTSRYSYFSHRNLLPYRKLFNAVPGKTGSPVYGWYYGLNPQTFYYAWCLANSCGQSALLLDENYPRTPDVPDYIAYGSSAGNMRRHGAMPIADVALFFSRATRNWGRDVPFEKELVGIAQELEAMHVPYEFVADFGVDASTFSKYRAVFLAAAQCLSDAEVAALLSYVEKGGTLQMSVRAGERDEEGVLRAAWPFEGKLGRYGDGRIVYDPDFGGVTRAHPEFTVRFRNGGFVATDAARNALQSKIRKVVGEGAWKISADEKVYVTPWREADGARVLHVLNCTGAPDPKEGDAAPKQIPEGMLYHPAGDVVVTMPAEGATTAVATSPDFDGERNLACSVGADGTLTFTLPHDLLKFYSVIRVK